MTSVDGATTPSCAKCSLHESTRRGGNGAETSLLSALRVLQSSTADTCQEGLLFPVCTESSMARVRGERDETEGKGQPGH